MSKTELQKFVSRLDRTELEEQVIDLYTRFKNVKEFYDFSFNPNEKKLYNDAKQKISKEYFPEDGRRAKKRRSVAHKIFKHLIKLEFDQYLLVDLMLYNIEIAQTYTLENNIKQYAFYKSMLKSYREALVLIDRNSFNQEFEDRINSIINDAIQQEWENAIGFKKSKKEIWANPN